MSLMYVSLWHTKEIIWSLSWSHISHQLPQIRPLIAQFTVPINLTIHQSVGWKKTLEHMGETHMVKGRICKQYPGSTRSLHLIQVTGAVSSISCNTPNFLDAVLF